MKITGERIRAARKALKMSQADLAKQVNISSGSIAMYETGAREPYGDTLIRIADVLQVSTDYLLGRTEKPAAPVPESREALPKNIRGIINSHMREVPVLGRIRAGKPILAVESAEGKVRMPDELLPPGEVFLVDVVGDSMEGAGIYDGDVALIQAQDSVDDNDIAAVMIDDEVTIKRVHWFNGYVALIPENRPDTPDIEKHIPTNHLAAEVKILGKFIMAIRVGER